MILAGDVGGTKTHLALFDAADDPPRRVDESFLATKEQASLIEAIHSFLARRTPALDVVVLGVAGPVVDESVVGVNLPWPLRAGDLSEALAGVPVVLLNDLAASACALDGLGPDDVRPLQSGRCDAHGVRALVSPGTGLGLAVVPRPPAPPIAGEGAHADFAPRTDEEIDLFRFLRSRYGRVSVERVVSGPGLINVRDWLVTTGRFSDEAAADFPDAAAIAGAARRRSSRLCVEAMRLWCSAFGAEAGNAALRALAAGGVYLGGGIPARVAEALAEGEFLRAFRDKPPHEALLESMPIWIVTNSETTLLGAVRVALDHVSARSQ